MRGHSVALTPAFGTVEVKISDRAIPPPAPGHGTQLYQLKKRCNRFWYFFNNSDSRVINLPPHLMTHAGFMRLVFRPGPRVEIDAPPQSLRQCAKDLIDEMPRREIDTLIKNSMFDKIECTKVNHYWRKAYKPPLEFVSVVSRGLAYTRKQQSDV